MTGAVNPSGKLVDTYAKSWEDYPSSSHWADSDGTDEEGNPIVYYTDDIYVGYRYFETFDVPVTYEFGYGLSYTDFTWSDYKLSSDGSGTMTATVQVENTEMLPERTLLSCTFLSNRQRQYGWCGCTCHPITWLWKNRSVRAGRVSGGQHFL